MRITNNKTFFKLSRTGLVDGKTKTLPIGSIYKDAKTLYPAVLALLSTVEKKKLMDFLVKNKSLHTIKVTKKIASPVARKSAAKPKKEKVITQVEVPATEVPATEVPALVVVDELAMTPPAPAEKPETPDVAKPEGMDIEDEDIANRKTYRHIYQRQLGEMDINLKKSECPFSCFHSLFRRIKTEMIALDDKADKFLMKVLFDDDGDRSKKTGD